MKQDTATQRLETGIWESVTSPTGLHDVLRLTHLDSYLSLDKQTYVGTHDDNDILLDTLPGSYKLLASYAYENGKKTHLLSIKCIHEDGKKHKCRYADHGYVMMPQHRCVSVYGSTARDKPHDTHAVLMPPTAEVTYPNTAVVSLSGSNSYRFDDYRFVMTNHFVTLQEDNFRVHVSSYIMVQQPRQIVGFKVMVFPDYQL